MALSVLEILAEAVNAVADWPQYWVELADSPARLIVGYRVGDQQWDIRIQDVKRSLPALYAKRDQLKRITANVKLPLRPYPEHQREREFMVRIHLLEAVAGMNAPNARTHAAQWMTHLGRLRAAPDGRFLNWEFTGVE
jgi:hypothetical protein